MKKILVFVSLLLLLIVPISAEGYKNYDTSFPEYVPISGGAWCEVVTDNQGTFTIVVPADYIYDTFGFSGSGYNIANVTNATVSGMAYNSGTFNYYGSPRRLQCRFPSMDTLQLYEPYQNTYGNTAYRWTDVTIKEIKATSFALTDPKGERANGNYRYSTGEKIGILIFVAVMALVLLKIFKKRRNF